MGLLIETIQNTITKLTSQDLKGCKKVANYVFYKCADLTNIELPSTILSLGKLCFGDTSSLASIKFLHSASDNITFPTAGSSEGAFYNKSARAINIYTDNETIKNYAWSTDGVTATFYHLDGTAWE